MSFLLWPEISLPMFGMQLKLNLTVCMLKILERGLVGGKQESKIFKKGLPILFFRVLMKRN